MAQYRLYAAILALLVLGLPLVGCGNGGGY